MRSTRWQLKSCRLEFVRQCGGSWVQNPALMAIVNVTPDSFSDGGNWFSSSAAIERAHQLIEDGAAILDIGGESTRPYSEPVSEVEELRRVIPVIQAICESSAVPVSIDTSKARVAAEAVAAGAQIINDVTGLEDPAMVQVALESGAGVCAMHMQGTVQTMQDSPRYDNVVEDIFGYLKQRFETLRSAGVDEQRICLDPGIGFGKTHEHNLTLLSHCRRFVESGQPILVGHSRKGFIGKLLGDKELERDSASTAISLYLAQQGVQVIRLHEVAAAARGLRALAACGGLGSVD